MTVVINTTIYATTEANVAFVVPKTTFTLLSLSKSQVDSCFFAGIKKAVNKIPVRKGEIWRCSANTTIMNAESGKGAMTPS